MAPERRSSRIARAVVGGLLVAESLAMLVAALSIAVIGGLAGAAALGAGAGAAKEAVLARGIGAVALATASPLMVTAALGLGGVLLLLRRRRAVIVAAGLLALAVQIAVHVLFEEGLHVAELVPCAVHVAAIAVGFSCVPPAAAAA